MKPILMLLFQKLYVLHLPMALGLVLLVACSPEEPFTKQTQATSSGQTARLTATFINKLPLVVTSIAPAFGPKETLVTLHGKRFAANPTDNTVTLNQQACLVLAASDSTLLIRIPAKAGSGPILVEALGKKGQSPPFTYLYTQSSVATLAGSSPVGDYFGGYLDGPASQALFNRPADLVLTAEGLLHVADRENNRIRRITAAGQVSTYAGTGPVDSEGGNNGGYLDGPVLQARFNSPEGMVLAPDGSIYIADGSNHRIRKISPSGQVTTVAGSGPSFGTGGYVDGAALQARFNQPRAIALAQDGTLYVADGNNHRIRKITPAGLVTTLAGSSPVGSNGGFADGPGAVAQFKSPYGLALAPDGTLYVADMGNHRIRKISPSSQVTTLAGSSPIGSAFGSYADGPALQAKFNQPMSVTLAADGTIYVADAFNNRVRRISPVDRMVSTVAGGAKGYADGAGSVARFSGPVRMALAADGTLYVADNGNHRIRKIEQE
jgi:sugar lactone lactonase YvrE